MGESVHATGDSDDDAHSSAGSDRTSAGIRLPRNRNSSPWSRRLLIVSVIVVVLLTPLWLDPWTLDELFGGSHATPQATVLPSPSARPTEATP